MKKSKKSEITSQIERLKEIATSTLKSEGKYTPLYGLQVEVAALLMAKIRLLLNDMSQPGYNAVELEESREGHDRKKVNPCETLLQTYISLVLKALKGLGMNTESKDVKTDSDTLKDFLTEFSEE